MARHRSSIADDDGRPVAPDHPDYDRVRLDTLEDQVRDLIAAVANLQHRVSHLDREPTRWPGHDYVPPDTKPFPG